MAYLNSRVYDEGLSVLDTAANVLHICSSLPANYAAVAGVSLGTKAAPTIGAPTVATPNGRKVVVSAITDGDVDVTGIATHVALVDTVGEYLLAAVALNPSQNVVADTVFTMNSFSIRIPDPA